MAEIMFNGILALAKLLFLWGNQDEILNLSVISWWNNVQHGKAGIWGLQVISDGGIQP